MPEKLIRIINNPSANYKRILEYCKPSLDLLGDQAIKTSAEEMFSRTDEMLATYSLIIVDEWNSNKKRDWNALVNRIYSSDRKHVNVVILTRQHLPKSMIREGYVKLVDRANWHGE